MKQLQPGDIVRVFGDIYFSDLQGCIGWDWPGVTIVVTRVDGAVYGYEVYPKPSPTPYREIRVGREQCVPQVTPLKSKLAYWLYRRWT